LAPAFLSELEAIDFETPWFVPWARWVMPVVQRVLAGASVAEALNQTRAEMGADAPGHFVPQVELPEGEAYEAFIARTRQVPTRDNLHDLLNGACWLRFGATKLRLNRLHGEQIARMGVGSIRGAVRDALTLFDENAALWAAPPELTQALAQRDWHALCVMHRELWAQSHLVLFGHALLEKLVHPYKSITAHVWLMPADLPHTDAAWDAHLAQALSPNTLVPKPFLPLPVMGIPGWTPDNLHPAYYADRQVFRN
jgi:hypothetical protein